jgi:hypothetical protein
MAFTVEDGSIVANANAYITVEFFREYFVDRGVTAAGLDTGAYGAALIQAAIIKATDYVDKRFGLKFKGYKSRSTQALQWPRIDVYDDSDYYISSSTIPKALRYAVAEYSNLARQLLDLMPIPALPYPTRDPATGETTVAAQGSLTYERVKAGPVETEERYADTSKTMNRGAGATSSLSSSSLLPEYPVADEWLKELCTTNGSICLERA